MLTCNIIHDMMCKTPKVVCFIFHYNNIITMYCMYIEISQKEMKWDKHVDSYGILTVVCSTVNCMIIIITRSELASLAHSFYACMKNTDCI